MISAPLSSHMSRVFVYKHDEFIKCLVINNVTQHNQNKTFMRESRKKKKQEREKLR